MLYCNLHYHRVITLSVTLSIYITIVLYCQIVIKIVIVNPTLYCCTMIYWYTILVTLCLTPHIMLIHCSCYFCILTNCNQVYMYSKMAPGFKIILECQEGEWCCNISYQFPALSHLKSL